MPGEFSRDGWPAEAVEGGVAPGWGVGATTTGSVDSVGEGDAAEAVVAAASNSAQAVIGINMAPTGPVRMQGVRRHQRCSTASTGTAVKMRIGLLAAIVRPPRGGPL